MGLTRNIQQYADVERVLTAAREHGGGTFQLPNYGAAVAWRRRAYFYRTLLAQGKRSDSNPFPETRWDDVLLTLEKGSDTVKIKFTNATPAGFFRDPDGKLVTFADRPKPRKQNEEVPVVDTDLLNEAKRLLEGTQDGDEE